MDNLEEVTLFGGKVKFIPVELTADWMGNAKGTQLSLNYITAQSLKDRGTAIYLSEKVKGAKTNDIAAPTKDKMMSKPDRQKDS